VALGRYWLTLGLYEAATGARQEIYSSVGTAETMSLGSVQVVEGADRVWIVSVSPEPGATLSGGQVVRVEVGYDLASAADGVLRLSLVAPDWEHSVNAQLPVEGFSDFVTVPGGIGQQTFEYTVEASDYLQILLGPTAGLMATLGRQSGDRIDVLAQRTYLEYLWLTGAPTATPFPADPAAPVPPLPAETSPTPTPTPLPTPPPAP
jgi:hypothetical protein